MKKVIAYLAASLDHYIATENGSVDWLNTVESEGDAGYEDLYSSIDVVVMGWNTYDWLCHNANEYPYKDKKSFVITNRQLPDTDQIHFTDDVISLLNQQKDLDGKNIWIVGGGKLISDLINHQLIDELRLTVAPVLLGSGIPLFTGIEDMEQIKLIKVTTYGQFVELRYAFERNE